MKPEADEAEVLAQTLYSMLKAKIVASEIELFTNLVACYFPGQRHPSWLVPPSQMCSTCSPHGHKATHTHVCARRRH